MAGLISMMRYCCVAVLLIGLGWGATRVHSAPSVRQIMGNMIDPAALQIWRSVATSVTADGVKETFPRNDKEWNDLRKAADLLAEGGTLLQNAHGGRAGSDWRKWSQAIVNAAEMTLKAVDAKSPQQILAAGEKIYDACVGCHGGYYSMRTSP